MDYQKIEQGFVRRPEGTRRYAFIGCEVLFREVSSLLPSCPHTLDLMWLSQGLHDLGGERMAAAIQTSIDTLAAKGVYDAILLGFALCNNGVLDLTCNACPLVVPKAHDCITLFLGSRERYQSYFEQNPGTYYLTTGWMERDDSKPEGAESETAQNRMGLEMSWDDMVAQYGEENARFLADTLGNMTAHYSRLTYIAQDYDGALGYVDEARKAAAEKGWEFDLLKGDLSLLQRLLWGAWDRDFVVAEPGTRLVATYTCEVMACAACRCGACPQA